MNKYRAETALSLLVAIALFAVMLLAFNRWQTKQNQQLSHHFQHQQAVLILENQLARQFAGLECERSVRQNQIQFEIHCLNNSLSIHFPMGKIELNRRSL